MGCACNKNRPNRVNGEAPLPKPETFEVVLNGKIVFKHTSAETAKAISNRYPDSIVREQSTSRTVHESTKKSAPVAK
ncbi:hypothetical protein ACFY0A_39730 [Streptomyces sp. NPDC001698]|uniref:hypothetical protein n=1 Tax=unclassified Streptomyces TaxID=2593676 RepID=UPI003695770F